MTFIACSHDPQVTRDRLMLALHEQFPQYNFAGGCTAVRWAARFSLYAACTSSGEPEDMTSCHPQAPYPGPNETGTVLCPFPMPGHKGYCVPEHVEAIRQHGPCPQHRRTFAPIKTWCASLACCPHQLLLRCCGADSLD